VDRTAELSHKPSVEVATQRHLHVTEMQRELQLERIQQRQKKNKSSVNAECLNKKVFRFKCTERAREREPRHAYGLSLNEELIRTCYTLTEKATLL